MTFEQLEYFITLVNENSYFDAAETLHISQSSLSKQILKLEKELEVSLFDRTHRRSELTEAGLRFYQESCALMEQYQKMQTAMKQFRISSSDSLRIGTLPILSQYGLGSVFQHFTEKKPDISLQIEEAEEAALASGLEKEEFDLAIIRQSLADLHDFRYWNLCNDVLTALLPSDHPAAKRFLHSGQTVSLRELSEDSFILMQKHTSVYQVCMQEFKRYHLTPEVIRTARVESILEYISLGNAVSLLPEKTLLVFDSRNTTAVPLNPPVPLNVVIAAKKGQNLSVPMRCFIDSIK